MRPEIDFAGASLQGDRDDQEDFHAFKHLKGNRLLLVLADGAGGQASGELASSTAARGFLDYFIRSRDATAPSLSAALYEANRRLAEFIERDPKKSAPMATTLLGLLLDGLTLHWISVGDSALLLYRGGTVVRLNADHSGGNTSDGHYLPKDVLRSALVGAHIPLIDWRRQPYFLKESDILLVASDGLWTLSQDEIATYLHTHATESADSIVHGLLQRITVRLKVYQDNATVAIVKVSG